jgi:opacity protein-like surface antigen
MVKNGRWLYILSVAGGVAFLPGVAAATDASGYLGGGVGYFRLDEKRFLDEDEDFRDNRFAWHATAGV